MISIRFCLLFYSFQLFISTSSSDQLAYYFSLFSLQIIDHLIRLGELLDLGFEEQKISDALVKFDNNKEKALDFLIS